MSDSEGEDIARAPGVGTRLVMFLYRVTIDNKLRNVVYYLWRDLVPMDDLTGSKARFVSVLYLSESCG